MKALRFALPLFLLSMFCKHRNLVFVRNIYGDEINVAGGKRSWWICADCERLKLRAMLRQYYRWEHKCPRCGGIVPSHDPLTGTCPVCYERKRKADIKQLHAEL